LLFAKGPCRDPALRRLARFEQKLAKTVRTGHVNAALGDEALVRFAALFVGLLLVRRQLDEDPPRLVRGQELARGIRNVETINEWANQFVKEFLGAVGAFRSRGEAEAEWGQSGSRRF